MENEELLKKQFTKLQKNSEGNLFELTQIDKLLTSFVNMTKSLTNPIDIETPNNKIDITNLLAYNKFNKICNSYNEKLKDAQDLYSNINENLLIPITKYKEDQEKIYKENIDKIKELQNNLILSKQSLLNAEYNYYNTSYDSTQNDQEKYEKAKLKGINNDESLNEAIRLKMQAKNYESIYKYEIKKYNKDMYKINELYIIALDEIKNTELNKIKVIKESINNFKLYIKNLLQNLNNFNEALNENFSDDLFDLRNKEIEEDLKTEKNIFKKDNEFPFISFNTFFQNFTKETEDLDTEQIQCKFDSILLSKKNEMDKKRENLNEYLNKEIDDLINNEEYSEEKLSEIFEYLTNPNDTSAQQEILKIIKKAKQKSIKFNSLKNLEYLAEIISYISLRNYLINKAEFNYNFDIIDISDKIFYQNKINNNKVYLSALLSKNKYFRTQVFWRNIIEVKLANKLANLIKDPKNFSVPLTDKLKDKKDMIIRMINTRSSSVHLNRNKSIIGKSRIYPLIKELYKAVPEFKINYLDNLATDYVFHIIKDFIPNFANFNFPSEQSLDLIADLVQQYKISMDNVNYFVAYSHVCSFSIIKLLPNESQDNYLSSNLLKLNQKKKQMKAIISSLKFLTYKDYLNLLLCNKETYKKVSKKIYANVLSKKDLNIKIRLSIWESLLKIKEIKKQINYKDILKKKIDKKLLEIIKLDIFRTRVNREKYSQEEQDKIINILVGVSQTNGEIKYYQGMNFVAQILYEMFGEEDAFYIFVGFFKNTEYTLIFEKNLEKLKVLFYVLKKIIYLLEPELANSFKKNQLDIPSFLTSWFVTLFTDTYRYQGKSNIEIFYRILDTFILKGVKSTMSICCNIFHTFEDKICTMKYDDLIKFFFNGIILEDYFLAKNLNVIENLFSKTKITKKLIKNIEIVYEKESKIENEKKKDINI